jgi:nucleoside-diphosphate-sugar epimerase
VSTEAVLTGDGPIRQVDESRRISPHPVGVYPATKAESERVALAANGPDLAVVVVRPRFIWGAGDTTLLPKLVEAVQSGAFMWFAGGRYLTSTCHVRNVCEGMVLAAERGRGGEAYFLTDGEPVEFRAFITAMLRTQGVDKAIPSVPAWVGTLVAAAGETAWRLLPLKGQPPLTRTAMALIGEEVTVVDAKARRELGYQGLVSREAGLAELAAEHARR